VLIVTICPATWYNDEIMEDEMVWLVVYLGEKRFMQSIGEKI
jgi:hypothetical protein